MQRGIPNKRYSAEFKQLVVEVMREKRLSLGETTRMFEISDHGIIKRQEKSILKKG